MRARALLILILPLFSLSSPRIAVAQLGNPDWSDPTCAECLREIWKEKYKIMDERRKMTGDDRPANSWRVLSELRTAKCKEGSQTTEVDDQKESGGEHWHRTVDKRQYPDGSGQISEDSILVWGDGDGNETPTSSSRYKVTTWSEGGRTRQTVSVNTQTDSEGAKQIFTSTENYEDGKLVSSTSDRQFIDKDGNPLEDPDWADRKDDTDPNAKKQNQGPPVTRTVAYRLGPCEDILKAESEIALSAGRDNLTLVTAERPGGPYKVSRDGKDMGSFTDLKQAMQVAYPSGQGSSHKMNNNAFYSPEEAPEGARVTTDDDTGGKIFQFKGKTFGPFLLASPVTTTPDGARAYYAGCGKESVIFGCTDGRSVAIAGLPHVCKFSPDGLNAAVFCSGTLNPLDPSTPALPSPEQMADLEKTYIFTIDGKRFGPFSTNFHNYDFWFASTANDLFYEINHQLYRNGVALMKAPCDRKWFYPSADGKSYAIYSYEQLTFSDGQKFPSPLDIVGYMKNGHSVLRWITMENKKDLVVYERRF